MPQTRPYLCSAHGNSKKVCALCHPIPPEPVFIDPLERYFEAVFSQRVEYDGDCWKWTGTYYSSGPTCERYGATTHPLTKLKTSAHRMSYELFCGPVDDRNIVHHICENTLCVNPQHLKQCASIDHTRHHVQQATRERWRNLAKNGNASLLNDRQLQILSLVIDGFTSADIAAQLGRTVKGVEFHKTNILKILRANQEVA